MIRTHRAQLDFGDEFIAGFIAEQPQELWEPWMRQVDQALDDGRLLEIIQDAWNRLCKKSKTCGRPGTPAEVILRLLLLKHIRDWSYEELEREVRANFVYRQFTRIGGGQVPDDKSMSRFSRQWGAAVIEKLHQRVVAIAQEKKIIQGRKLRVDTTVVETNIHYPTDSTLLGDGARVLTRVMKKVTAVAGQVGLQLRDRMRHQAPHSGDRTGQPRPQRKRQTEARDGLPQAARRHRPGGRAGPEVLFPNCQQGQARSAQGLAEGPAAVGRDDPARGAGHAADAPESAGRRHARGRQNRQRL
jgi:hypothetical protein